MAPTPGPALLTDNGSDRDTQRDRRSSGRASIPSRSQTIQAKLSSGILVTPGVMLLVSMVVVPMIVLLWYSALADTGRPADFSIENYARLTTTSLYIDLFIKSLRTAAVVAGITALVAWPGAWALSRTNPRRRQLLLSLVIVPYLTSYLLLIYAVFVLLGAGGPVMSALDFLGLASADSSIIYTHKATIFMLVYENLPIMLLVLYAASERIENNMLAAAQSLGAGALSRFFRIVLPLSVPSLLTGFVLVFVPVDGTFVESQILGRTSAVRRQIRACATAFSQVKGLRGSVELDLV